MVNMAKSIAGTAIGIGSLALVGESMKMIPHDFGAPMKRKGKGKNTRKTTPFVKGAVNLMVGTALLGGAASMVNKM